MDKFCGKKLRTNYYQHSNAISGVGESLSDQSVPPFL